MREVKLCVILSLTFIYMVYEVYSETVLGLEAIPERAEIVYRNDKYIHNSSVNVRRYNRKGAYVINIWGIIKQTWANNVSVDIVFYEYLHNEYKRSFVEMHYKLCDLINKDEFIGAAIRKRGMKCPLEKGLNGMANATLSFPKFPYVFPFQKCKAEIIFVAEPSREVIGKGFVYFLMKQYTEKKKN